jgi:hypothetical protein
MAVCDRVWRTSGGVSSGYPNPCMEGRTMSKWARTCQECGHVQRTLPPATPSNISDTYANAKCRKCKSPALDYGRRERDDDPTNKEQARLENIAYSARKVIANWD